MTKEDLQAIGALLDSKLSAALEPMRGDIAELRTSVTELRADITELRETVEADIAELRADVTELRDDVTELRDDVTKLSETVEVVRASQLIFEVEHLPRIQIALDGIEAGVDKNKAQDERIEALELKAEDHDIRFFALEHAVNAK